MRHGGTAKLVMAMVVAVLPIAGGVWALATGQILAGVLTLAIGLGWVALAALLIMQRRPPSTDGARIETGPDGVTLRWSVWPTLVPLGSAALLSLLAACVGALVLVTGPTGPQGARDGRTIAWICFGFAALIFLLVPDGVLRLARGGHLRLLPDRIEVRAWDADVVARWEDVWASEAAGGMLRLNVRPGAPAQFRFRPKVLFGSRKRTHVDMPFAAFDVPRECLLLALGDWDSDPALRAAELRGPAARARLLGHAPAPPSRPEHLR